MLTVGDGTWLYNPISQGLMAAAQYGLPLLVVIFNNKKYLSMRFNLTRAYPDGEYVTSKSGYGVDLSAQPDAAAVAAFEMLASGLVANPIVPGYHSGTKEGRRHRQNAFILAVDVSAFLPLDEFTATVDETVDAIKSLPPADETREVLVPGERGRRSEAERAASGIPLGPKVWRELSEIAAGLGVAVPAPIG